MYMQRSLPFALLWSTVWREHVSQHSFCVSYYEIEKNDVFVRIAKCICNAALLHHLVRARFTTNTHSSWVIFFPHHSNNQSYLPGSSGGQKVVCQKNSILNWPQKQWLRFHPSLTCRWWHCFIFNPLSQNTGQKQRDTKRLHLLQTWFHPCLTLTWWGNLGGVSLKVVYLIVTLDTKTWVGHTCCCHCFAIKDIWPQLP